MAIHRINSFYQVSAGGDIKRSTFTHSHPSDVDACCLEFGRDNGPYPVARLEASNHLLAHLVATWNPIFAPERPAMVTPAHSSDTQGFDFPSLDARKLAHAKGVEGVCLLDIDQTPVLLEYTALDALLQQARAEAPGSD